jgi:WD40 repeat protein
MILQSHDETLHLVALESGHILGSVEGPVSTHAVSNDGRWLALASCVQEEKPKPCTRSAIELRSLPSLETIGTLPAHAGAITDLDFDRRGERLVSLGTDQRLLVWSVPD